MQVLPQRLRGLSKLEGPTFERFQTHWFFVELMFLGLNLWGKVIGLVRPMRLIDKSLQELKRGVLEYASHIIFSHFGWLDESETAVSD
ncbi:MAG: hypothetical protein ACPGSB_02445 [Opitutales bacterium]